MKDDPFFDAMQAQANVRGEPLLSVIEGRVMMAYPHIPAVAKVTGSNEATVKVELRGVYSDRWVEVKLP